MLTKVTTVLSSIGLSLVLVVPLLAFGQTPGFDPDGGAFGQSLANIIDFINTYIIPFILGIGFLFFVWGMFLYFIKGGADEGAQEQGKSLIIYALAGFVLIFIFWGLVQIIATGSGLDQNELDDTLVPSAIRPGA